MNSLYSTLMEVLKQKAEFFSENGELLRNAVYEAAMKMDSNLIKLLYENEVTKSRFFTVVDGIAVFDKVGFGWVINNKEFLPDSYTRFRNKIGLVDESGSFISSSNDVLQNVISGEQGGISKQVNWQGGGSFIYCELAKLNQNYVDKIESATTDAELVALLAEIIKTDFISYKVNPAEIKENAKSFEELTVDDKKRFLIELLDKNQLYVNYCDIDDENYHISEEDKAFTKSFYGDK